MSSVFTLCCVFCSRYEKHNLKIAKSTETHRLQNVSNNNAYGNKNSNENGWFFLAIAFRYSDRFQWGKTCFICIVQRSFCFQLNNAKEEFVVHFLQNIQKHPLAQIAVSFFVCSLRKWIFYSNAHKTSSKINKDAHQVNKKFLLLVLSSSPMCICWVFFYIHLCPSRQRGNFSMI